MPTEGKADTLLPRLLPLSAAQQQRFLARYTFELTTRADQVERARHCNESIYRLFGYLPRYA